MRAEVCSNRAHSATRSPLQGIAREERPRPLHGRLACLLTSLAFALLVAVSPTATPAAPDASDALPQAVDVVFVLDNSGSMRTNDPGFLTRRAVQKFAAALAEDPTIDGRIALVLFDDQATLVQPLVAADELVGGNRLAGALAALDFSGQRTNSPAGVERALYELRERGRDGARRAIVFLSDGRIDTGDARNDLELGRWLREDLAGESEENDIRIFGIAFTDGADYQLMQALARRTRARYYRAFAAEDLESVVDDVLATVDEPPTDALADSALPTGPDRPAASAVAAADAGEPWRGPGLLGWLPVAMLLVGAGYLVARRRSSPPGGSANAAPPAQLLDSGGMLGEAGRTLPLTSGRTTIGRDPKNDIVLPDDTISSEHALIEVHDGRYWLIDLRSTNGTRHGARRLAPDERVALKGGDHVRFAEIDLMFVVEGYVPGGATVYLSSSTTPPLDWSVLASSAEAEPNPARPSGEDVRAPAPSAGSEAAADVAAREQARADADGDAPSGGIVFAEQRERIDPASVVDLDQALGAPFADQSGSVRFPAESEQVAEADEQVETARDARATGALEDAEPSPETLEAPERLEALDPADAQSAAATPSAPRSAESSRPLALLRSPEPDDVSEAEVDTEVEAYEARGAEAETGPEVVGSLDGPTAEVGPPSDGVGDDRTEASTESRDRKAFASDELRDCLDYHLARVSEISPAFASFVDRAFDEELRSALPVAARDLLESAGESGRIEEREYTFDRIRYLICAVPSSMEGARDRFVERYGGFTRLLAEQLQAESFLADRCEILALLTFGIADAPWVSLTIVPDEGQDPQIDLLSYELLTESERAEIEPSLDAEISQSGLA